MIGVRTILRKKSKANMTGVNTNVSEEIVKQEIDKLFIKYKVYFTDATELWQLFQHELASARAKEGNTKVATEIDMMETT